MNGLSTPTGSLYRFRSRMARIESVLRMQTPVIVVQRRTSMNQRRILKGLGSMIGWSRGLQSRLFHPLSGSDLVYEDAPAEVRHQLRQGYLRT